MQLLAFISIELVLVLNGVEALLRHSTDYLLLLLHIFELSGQSFCLDLCKSVLFDCLCIWLFVQHDDLGVWGVQFRLLKS